VAPPPDAVFSQKIMLDQKDNARTSFNPVEGGASGWVRFKFRAPNRQWGPARLT
jgi:hypothetical protein